MSSEFILPRFIRLRDAPNYLGMDRNRFNHEVRPNIQQIPIGTQGVAFDRLDLDQWAEHYKKRVARPNNLRGKLWVKSDMDQELLGYCNEESSGVLTKRSLDDEYEKLLGLPTTKKQKLS